METDRHPSTIVDAQCGVSWAAVAAGAVGAAALALLLIAFGAGLGLSAISPSSDSGVSASTFKTGTGIYLVIVAVMSSAVGGYLAARLRTKWAGFYTHEVFFQYRTRFSRLGLCNAFKRDRPEFGRGISCKWYCGGRGRRGTASDRVRQSSGRSSISSSARAPRRLRPPPGPIPQRPAMLLPINRGQK